MNETSGMNAHPFLLFHTFISPLNRKFIHHYLLSTWDTSHHIPADTETPLHNPHPHSIMSTRKSVTSNEQEMVARDA